jgi:hypothetical protein
MLNDEKAKKLKARFWELIEPNVDAYSRKLERLLDLLPRRFLKQVVEEMDDSPMTAKPSKRKFYRSVISVEVLSEDPLPPDLSLAEIHEGITTGDWSGQVDNDSRLNEEIDGPTAAKALMAQASDPGFFRRTEEGEDDDDEEEDEE